MVAARVLWRRSTPAPAPHQQLGADLVKACTPDNFCKKLEVISRHQTAKWFEAKNLGTRFRTADREEKGVGTGNTWWALFASEEIGEGIGTWCRAAARGGSSRGTWVYTCTPNNFRKKLEVTRHGIAK